jgi:thiol-disulfide isomerase/thioredoxin
LQRFEGDRSKSGNEMKMEESRVWRLVAEHLRFYRGRRAAEKLRDCALLLALLTVPPMFLSGAALTQEAGEQALTPTHFPAPEFPPPDDQQYGITWINTFPLTMQGLRGKVVLIDFWEYTCINCVRTFAENKNWYHRYHQDGFEIIGVHAPEFDIAYSVANVRQAVKRFALPYPVVVDDQFRIWGSYQNNSWPSRFLVDAKGVVRFHRDGEGGDSAFEQAIQALLKEAHPNIQFPSSYTIPRETNAFAPSCGIPTPEMYVGNWDGRGALANPEGYQEGKTIDYKLPSQILDGQAALSGRWQTDRSGMIYRGKSKDREPGPDRLVMRYHARELYSVINVSHGGPSRLYLEQDGKPLVKTNRGVDVQFDERGRSFIEVHEPRMYYLTANPAFGSHTLTLRPTKPGLTINSFTFGNNCQTDFPHL